MCVCLFLYERIGGKIERKYDYYVYVCMCVRECVYVCLIVYVCVYRW